MIDLIPEHICKASNKVWARMADTYAHVFGLPGPACLARRAYVVLAPYDYIVAARWLSRFYEGTRGDQTRYRVFTQDIEFFVTEVQQLRQLVTEDEGDS